MNDPWEELVPSTGPTSLNARRVDPASRWQFYWGKGSDRRCVLALQHSSDVVISAHLPVLRGIECVLTSGETERERLLCLKLQDSTQKDLFHRLCLDIISAGKEALSEAEVVERTIARTWRWHHLLRGGSDRRLSLEEQKGLIGELIVMETILIPNLRPKDAASAWHGPLGAPKDFQIGRIAIEAKARRGGAIPHVGISSEDQLDESGTDALFLHVSELDEAAAEDADSFTVTTKAEQVRELLRIKDPAASDAFDTLLLAGGFRWEDDYSDAFWIAGPSNIYRVSDDFPRIQADRLLGGVSSVTYSVALRACEPFHVAAENVIKLLSGDRNAN
jgi:Putative  PD-(D/E)XK family member, (DUF4420)